MGKIHAKIREDIAKSKESEIVEVEARYPAKAILRIWHIGGVYYLRRYLITGSKFIDLNKFQNQTTTNDLDALMSVIAFYRKRPATKKEK